MEQSSLPQVQILLGKRVLEPHVIRIHINMYTIQIMPPYLQKQRQPPLIQDHESDSLFHAPSIS